MSQEQEHYIRDKWTVGPDENGPARLASNDIAVLFAEIYDLRARLADVLKPKPLEAA